MGKKEKRRKALKELIVSKQAALVQKPPTEKKKKVKRQPIPSRREHPNWPLVGLASAGMLLTAYLVITSWLGGQPLYCQEGSTCDIVQNSRWGTLMYLPTAFWGFMTYAVLAYIGLRVRSAEWHFKSAWVVSMVGLGYSLYLNAISFIVIEALCVYCLASLLIMTVIFIVVASQRPKGLIDFKYPAWAGTTIVFTLMIIGGMHLHYSGVFDPAAGPEDPFLKGLAQHLTKNEAVFYGAYW